MAAPFRVVVHRRQIVVDEGERMDELDRERRRHYPADRGSERLADRKRDHGAHTLAADLERVAHGCRLAVQLRPELQPLERVVDECLQLVRTVHPPPPRAERGSAPPRPPSRAPTARRAARSRARATLPLPPRAARARRALPRPAPAAPPPASTIRRCSIRLLLPHDLAQDPIHQARSIVGGTSLREREGIVEHELHGKRPSNALLEPRKPRLAPHRGG